MTLDPELQFVSDFLESHDLHDRLVVIEGSMLTADQSAAQLRITKESIAKSLLFLADEKPVLVITPGNKRVDTKRLKEILAAQKVVLADPDTTFALTGFTVKGVPPVAHKTSIPVYIDSDLRSQTLLHAAAGNEHAMFKVTFEELVTITGAQPM